MTNMRMLPVFIAVLAGCSGSSSSSGGGLDAGLDGSGSGGAGALGGGAGVSAGGTAGAPSGGTAGAAGSSSGGAAGSPFSPCAAEAFACYYPLDKGCTNHQCNVAEHCCVWPCLKDSDCNYGFYCASPTCYPK
jgi:hypothetical protein